MARPDTLPTLTDRQKLALIDAWPAPVRVLRDLTCPACGYYEMGQTLHSELPELLYCRRCNTSQTELKRWRDTLTDPLEVLATLATRSWNRDLTVLEREQAKPLALAAARVAVEAGIVPKFAEACMFVGPIGSRAAARRLCAEVSAR